MRNKEHRCFSALATERPRPQEQEPAPLHYRDKGDPTYGLDKGKTRGAVLAGQQKPHHNTSPPAPRGQGQTSPQRSSSDTPLHHPSHPTDGVKASPGTEDTATPRRDNSLFLSLHGRGQNFPSAEKQRHTPLLHPSHPTDGVKSSPGTEDTATPRRDNSLFLSLHGRGENFPSAEKQRHTASPPLSPHGRSKSFSWNRGHSNTAARQLSFSLSARSRRKLPLNRKQRNTPLRHPSHPTDGVKASPGTEDTATPRRTNSLSLSARSRSNCTQGLRQTDKRFAEPRHHTHPSKQTHRRRQQHGSQCTG